MWDRQLTLLYERLLIAESTVNLGSFALLLLFTFFYVLMAAGRLFVIAVL